MAEQYQQAGLHIHAQTTPQRIDKNPDGTLKITADSKSNGKVELDGFDVILMATGRRPNTKNMGLEDVGPPLDLPLHVPTVAVCKQYVQGCTCLLH